MSLRSFPPLSQRSALRAGGRSRRSGEALAREPLSGLRPLHVSWMLRTLNEQLTYNMDTISLFPTHRICCMQRAHFLK